MNEHTFQQQVAIALAAIGQHMHEHDLASPINIDIDRVRPQIMLRVPDEDSQRSWINTLAIDGEENEPWMGPDWTKTTWSVRLPNLGVRFKIRGLRRTPAALQDRTLTVVPA